MATPNLEIVDTDLPHSQEEVIEQLLAAFDELPGQLQLCARYLIDHPHEVGLQSMRTLAANAEVHPNSFVRLARHLGAALSHGDADVGLLQGRGIIEIRFIGLLTFYHADPTYRGNVALM